MSKYDINLNTSHFDSILGDLDKLKTRVDELINSHKLLNDKLNAKQLIIKELEAKLSPKKEIIFVVCENIGVFNLRGFNQSIRDDIEYRYVHGVETLKGISNPSILFVDDWMNRTDIFDIINQVRIAKR
jgi:hypothetical protein